MNKHFFWVSDSSDLAQTVYYFSLPNIKPQISKNPPSHVRIKPTRSHWVLGTLGHPQLIAGVGALTHSWIRRKREVARELFWKSEELYLAPDLPLTKCAISN